MGFGNNGSGKPRIFCKVEKRQDSNGNDRIYIMTGKKDDPHLFSYVDGVLIDVQPFEGEYEGNKTFRVRFILDDGENEIWLESGRYTGFTRDVVNCLSTLDVITSVRLTPYLSEDENTKKKYIRGAVRVGADFSVKLEKRFKGGEMPKIQVVKVGKKDVFDSSELDEWTDTLIEIVKKKIKAVPAPTQKQETHEVEDDGELPF